MIAERADLGNHELFATGTLGGVIHCCPAHVTFTHIRPLTLAYGQGLILSVPLHCLVSEYPHSTSPATAARRGGPGQRAAQDQPSKRCRRQGSDGGIPSQMGSFGNSGASVIFYYYKNIMYVYLLIFTLVIRTLLAGTNCQF